MFDEDKEGYITLPKLRQIMINLGERMTDEELQEMIRMADVEKKGKIDFEGTIDSIDINVTKSNCGNTKYYRLKLI